MKSEKTSLAQRLADEAARQAAEAAKKVDYTAAVAAAWDASGYAGSQPWLVGNGGIYGDRASLTFKDAGPDELVALMKHFPAIPRVQYSHSGIRYFHPVGGRTIPEGADVSEFDGFEIEISGGRGYENLRAGWSAMVGDVQTAFRVELRRVSFLHPRASRKSVVWQGNFLRYEGRAELNWPREFPGASVMMEAGITAFGYALSDQCFGDFRLRGRNVLALALAWETEANRRGEQTRAAFLAAFAPVQAMGLPGADDVAAQAAKIRDQYERENLRSGTLEQTAALQTPHAVADKAVAEKHWPEYAAANGLETRQGYFDHYAWACAFLSRCGLYEVPRGEGTYKYGHAWL
ncbi:TPA: hypothetical protein ACQTZL_003746 [Pseudomonas aeruginosa]|uniref:hypothetical protein n=1 Tax=Pseudomonas aeruginosa TaxID=287 RepID=UPI001AAE3BFB|nr:hypothetical protein [Pseudomonas aeruginosa]MBO2857150.1 hypothetical protein [Pseudomonas aeruginosa]